MERCQGVYNYRMGFEEIAHTADWAVRVWAADLPALFAESARAMNALAGTVIGAVPRVQRTFKVQGPDSESLLVAFLSELVYLQEQENLAFDAFKVNVESDRLTIEMEGARVESIDKAIKAVTYHNLRIRKTDERLETTIVFDV